MLKPDSTGRLVEEEDVSGLADAVKSILELPAADYSSLARDGREFVVTSRSLTGSARQLLAHYEAVLQ